MIIVTQAQLSNKDTKDIIRLRNEIKASFNTNAIDCFTISNVVEIVYNNNKVEHKEHDTVTAIKDTIVRHAGIICDKLGKEDDYTLQYPLRGGYSGYSL